MKSWGNFFKVIIFIIGIMVLSFNVLLYNSFERQKNEINTISDQQKAEAQVNSNKFKYQQDQIESLSKDLEDENKSIQTSLVDIKAEADAIKQNMKGWQKDYVSVLAELEKKNDDAQNAIKSLEKNLAALNIPKLKEDINSLKADIGKMTPVPEKKDKDANQS